MKISFAQPAPQTSGTLVVGVFGDGVLTPEAAELDTATGGAVTRALQASRFTGAKAQTLSSACC
jgi:leucyl aminopeptidase